MQNLLGLAGEHRSGILGRVSPQRHPYHMAKAGWYTRGFPPEAQAEGKREKKPLQQGNCLSNLVDAKPGQ